MVAQRLGAHEQPEWPPDVVRRVMRRRAWDGVAEREDLLGRRDVVGGAGQEIHGTVDASAVDRLAVDAQRSADELVVAEEVLDEPQIERAGDVLGVLNQSSKAR